MEDYPATAQLLLAMAAEAGHNIWAIDTPSGGFEVPEDIWRQFFAVPEERTPPAGWDEPLPPSDVELVDGRYMLTDEARARMVDEIANPWVGVDEPITSLAVLDELNKIATAVASDHVSDAAGREEIRAWAKDHGYDPAPQGKLKAAVVEAFRAANPDRATLE